MRNDLQHLRTVRQSPIFVLLVLMSASAAGCASQSNGPAERTLVQPADADARALSIFDGSSGEPIAWNDLIERLSDSDIVILGGALPTS